MFCYKSVIDFSDTCPNSLREALTCSESDSWKRAIEKEVRSLQQHNVWDTNAVERQEGMSVIKTKFIFQKKNGASESEIFKARLVAQGFAQVKGLDYSETFSGVVDKVSVRLAFHVIASRNMKCFKFDVSTAFLNAQLQEENIYVQLPADIFPESLGKVHSIRSQFQWNQVFIWL